MRTRRILGTAVAAVALVVASLTMAGGATVTTAVSPGDSRVLTCSTSVDSTTVTPKQVTVHCAAAPATTTTVAPATTTRPTTATTAAPTTTTSSPAPTTTTLPVPPPPAGSRLFADTSLWNTVKGPQNYYPAADGVLSSRNYGINNADFSRPLFIATASDPMWLVHSGAGWGEPDRTVAFHAPANIHAAAGSDGVLDVYDSTTGTLWDGYQASQINPGQHTYSTAFLVDSDGKNGPGFGCYPGATCDPGHRGLWNGVGTTAIGAPQAGGVITAGDVASGTIPHAEAIAFDYSDLGGVGTSGGPACVPAVGNDAGGGPGPIFEGGLLLIPPTVTMPSGLTKMEQAAWHAAQTYGVYVADRLGGQPLFYGDGSTAVGNAFTDGGLTKIGRALRLVKPLAC